MKIYLAKRIGRGILSTVIVVAVVMLLVYACVDRNDIFKDDPVFAKKSGNDRQVYMMQRWQDYGYVDYVPYTAYLQDLLKAGTITREQYALVARIGATASLDSPQTAAMIETFTQKYRQEGYTVVRLDQERGKQSRLYAYRDKPFFHRLVHYFKNLVVVDNIHNAETVKGERGLRFTLYDPAYGGKTFAPAIMGNGTTHRYLLYFDDHFPYLHQNLIRINLGESFSGQKNQDVFDTMTAPQGDQEQKPVTYPTGLKMESSDDLHTAVYVRGSGENPYLSQRFTDDYTQVSERKTGLSKLGYSFVMGIIAVVLAYLIAIPVGTLMARHKDRLPDMLGTAYVVFVMAVPTLAYVFMVKALGNAAGLPTTFTTSHTTWQMYILPIVSLALPSAANLMKWLRRYMIDQHNADYVKFARANGVPEKNIFSGHVLKNAMIPMLHALPASLLGALVGAIITERVYTVPGVGNQLTQAIENYDNAVVVGLTLFYALISVLAVLLGDLLISMADPRINLAER